MGSFSIINPTNGLAFAIKDESCKNNMDVITEADDYNSDRQKFYLGMHGSIFSGACPGLVLSIDTNATVDNSVKLEVFRLGEKNSKWKFLNGTIESVKHQGMVIATNDVDNTLVLQDNTTLDRNLAFWERSNTRLLEENNDQIGWEQAWTVSFIEPEDTNLESFASNHGEVATCYGTNAAFSASFEDFAQQLVIVDAGDEEQCQKVREELGFDKDHPFDTDIRDSFYQHQVCSSCTTDHDFSLFY